MAVEHNMAELNTTWWDLLQKICVNLNWSYAALWTVTPDGGNLIWKHGYFHMRSNDYANAELFHRIYSSCTFTPGVGLAGHALSHFTNSILWLSGEDLDSLEPPVPNQTHFLRAAGIQTVVCYPLGLPSSSYVLELGSVGRVRETDAVSHYIKRVLLQVLADGLRHIIEDNTVAAIAHQPAADLFSGQMGALLNNLHSPSSVGMGNLTALEPPRKYASSIFPSGLERVTTAAIRKPQQQLGPNIPSELLQPMEHVDSFVGQMGGGNLDLLPPPLLVDVPNFPGSEEPSPGKLTSPWSTESSSQMELNALQSWTSMAEATSTLDSAFRSIPGSSPAISSRLSQEIVSLKDQIGQLLPFTDILMSSSHEFDQQQSFLDAAPEPSLRRSTSRGSSFPSQNVADSALSSAIYESYADCISSFSHGGDAAVVSSSSTMRGESESTWRSGAHQGSGSSSKETSPDSKPSAPQFSHGIHPRISSTKSFSRRQQQQQAIDIQKHGSTPAGPSPSQRGRLLESQHSGIVEVPELQKAGPSAVADSTPTLVQFGNVLQLGNAAGQVIEALPQEHDEAAVSHMLAERRRRTKQNENFSQLKFLIPNAGKMDKASLLAATIVYIHELKERVNSLEQSNQTLKNQLQGTEQELLSTVAPLTTTKTKGSPGRVRVRTPKSLSPTDEDKIQVSPDGDGNLTIDIRHPCNQPDTAMQQILAFLREIQMKLVNFNFGVNDNRIHASITVKMKRKNSAGQSAVCAEVEQALRTCLNNLG